MADFRPIREEWGEASACFVEPNTLKAIMEAIADHTVEEGHSGKYFAEVGDGQEDDVLWILRGKEFLNFVESSEFCSQWLLQNLEDHEPDQEAVKSLIQNMKVLAAVWRPILDRDGSLRFRIG